MEKIKFDLTDTDEVPSGYLGCPKNKVNSAIGGREGTLGYMDNNEKSVEFFVLEQAKINGVNYILVTDSEEDDAEALILKDLSEEDDAEALYEILEEDGELEAISKVFSEMLEDVDII